jgi:hypothetical protein
MIKHLNSITQFTTFQIHGKERVPNKKCITFGAIKMERWRLFDDTGMNGRTESEVSVYPAKGEKRS